MVATDDRKTGGIKNVAAAVEIVRYDRSPTIINLSSTWTTIKGSDDTYTNYPDPGANDLAISEERIPTARQL